MIQKLSCAQTSGTPVDATPP